MVTKPYTAILIMLPNLVMIMDLSLHVSDNSLPSDQIKEQEIKDFFQNISYLGISEAII